MATCSSGEWAPHACVSDVFDIPLFMDRHWPIGLIYDNYTITSTLRPNTSTTQVTPLRLILHLASPPTDKLLLSPSAEACKQAFMGQLKEADFIRWGNTKRMTGLRKAEQDGLWEGIRDRERNLRDQSPALS